MMLKKSNETQTRTKRCTQTQSIKFKNNESLNNPRSSDKGEEMERNGKKWKFFLNGNQKLALNFIA